jgi:hypothetical protein
MMDAAKIVRVASLMHEVDSGADAAEFERELAELSQTDKQMVIFAGKVLEGKPYQVTSDGAEFIARYREMALHLAATIREIEEDGGITRVVFAPPSKH